MNKVKVYNLAGKSEKEVALDPKLFAVEVNKGLVHRAVVTQMANSRQPFAHAKTRKDVRGGGTKPWRQKGTGRARHGSIRSPIWKGGGVTFGPTKERNFTKKINQQEKTKALLSLLTDKVKNKKLVMSEEIAVKDGKTKELVAILGKLPVKDNSALLVLSKPDVKIKRAAKNLPDVKVTTTESLNVIDVITHKYFVVTPEGQKEMIKNLLKS